jgi:hypothetical protein
VASKFATSANMTFKKISIERQKVLKKLLILNPLKNVKKCTTTKLLANLSDDHEKK